MIELIQFPYSHYNEKARWALDWKRVPHARRSLLPGPHAPYMLWLTRQMLVPAVRFEDGIVNDSAAIIDALEQRFPEPPLYPDDPAERERALEIQRHFDTEVGPRVRRALFADMLKEPAYAASMFSEPHSPLVRSIYGVVFPGVALVMKRAMGITDAASIEDAVDGTVKALDFVAKEAGPDGFLVGDRFSVADLAAAALLAPLAAPPDSPMTKPEPVPERILACCARFADHPGTAWVHETYRRHRPASAEVAG